MLPIESELNDFLFGINDKLISHFLNTTKRLIISTKDFYLFNIDWNFLPNESYVI